MDPYKTPAEIEDEPKTNWTDKIRASYIVVPLIIVGSIFCFICMQKHDAWLEDQCKPDHYRAEYTAARGLYQIECVSKEGRSRTIFYEK